MTADAGRRMVTSSWAGTALFAATSGAAAVWPDVALILAFVTALVLFVAGCACFVAAYALAVARSRESEIGMGGLFFLQGSAPRPVRRALLGSLAVQVVVAVATAAARPYTTLAFGTLVPIFGLALSGLWAARHGSFSPRAIAPTRPAVRHNAGGRSEAGRGRRPVSEETRGT